MLKRSLHPDAALCVSLLSSMLLGSLQPSAAWAAPGPDLAASALATSTNSTAAATSAPPSAAPDGAASPAVSAAPTSATNAAPNPAPEIPAAAAKDTVSAAKPGTPDAPAAPQVVEPETPSAAGAQNTIGAGATVTEPPLPPAYTSNPTATDSPLHVAPLWSAVLGARLGWLFPLGSAWQDGTPIDGACCVYSDRPLSEFVSPGPMFEIDLGARLNRHYQVFVLWERASLGGGALKHNFGGQLRGSSNYLGAGLKFSTNPDGLGLVVEMAVGWRRIQAEWANGTDLTLTDDFLNARVGAGAELRVSDALTVSALVTVGGGSFGDVKWTFADGSSRQEVSTLDRYSQHVPVSLQIAAHFDAFRRMD